MRVRWFLNPIFSSRIFYGFKRDCLNYILEQKGQQQDEICTYIPTKKNEAYFDNYDLKMIERKLMVYRI